MADVFISYKRENLIAVQRLVRSLRAGGLSVWWDQEIAPDAPWEATIERELAAAKVVIVAWSPAAVASENVKAEARRARADGRLIQVFIEPCAPPLFFGERQGLEFSGWNGDVEAGAYKALLAAVSALVAGQRPPTAAGYSPNGRRQWFAWTPLSAALVVAGVAALGTTLLLAWEKTGQRSASEENLAIVARPKEARRENDPWNVSHRAVGNTFSPYLLALVELRAARIWTPQPSEQSSYFNVSWPNLEILLSNDTDTTQIITQAKLIVTQSVPLEYPLLYMKPTIDRCGNIGLLLFNDGWAESPPGQMLIDLQRNAGSGWEPVFSNRSISLDPIHDARWILILDKAAAELHENTSNSLSGSAYRFSGTVRFNDPLSEASGLGANFVFGPQETSRSRVGGGPMPITGAYDLELRASGRDYSVMKDLAHSIEPGAAERITLAVSSSASSQHELFAELQFASGRVERFGPYRIETLVPSTNAYAAQESLLPSAGFSPAIDNQEELVNCS